MSIQSSLAGLADSIANSASTAVGLKTAQDAEKLSKEHAEKESIERLALKEQKESLKRQHEDEKFKREEALKMALEDRKDARQQRALDALAKKQNMGLIAQASLLTEQGLRTEQSERALSHRQMIEELQKSKLMSNTQAKKYLHTISKSEGGNN